ncbi:glycosyltransferase family 4 protein [Geodermatophilus sp. YIM 151500]|uniref:glycosyltransferase family 4 protein n=1 Tax=Geodermatophilus sp. YIM 151500 TaxID=2984531 RepID=UPI0021E3C192|nr:glycosyltransferase family 4 protein [Geodermatophilus sp. YIM 151500]MCV2491120.1 glycosyltransferase family 4 protein [Geodermatophilus sp. YIM 151500]
MRPSPAEASPAASAAPLAVRHFGNDARSVRGGIAAVIRQHLESADGRLSVTAVPTYDPEGRGHRRRNAPYLRALGMALGPRRDGGFVAHVHISQGGSLLREGLLVALMRLRRTPVVVTLHGSSSLTSTGLPRLLTGLVLRCASVAHFLSEAHRSRYARVAGRSVTLPNAVPVAPPSGTARRPAVVFAGVVGTRKGVDVLLEAWTSITGPVAVPAGGAPRPGGGADGLADWVLHLYGPPDHDFAVPTEVPGVVVHGEVPPAEVRAALAEASVAVLPSREEAFPVFLLEALAQRCAVVATDVGGVRELMGDAGELVPAGDPAALGAALRRVLTDPDRRAELSSAAGRRAAERFDAALVARTWARTYASLVEPVATDGTGGTRG